MKTNLVDIGLKDAEGNPTPVWDGVSSAASTSEVAAPSGAFSVTGGSLSVSSAEALVRRWRAQRDDFAKAQAACAAAADKEGETMWDGMATALNGCANDMLRSWSVRISASRNRTTAVRNEPANPNL